MKDQRGIYYYPFPQNKRVHMYVKEDRGEIYFRLWNADDPELWKEHGWVPYGAVQQAISMYQGKGFDPRTAYDLEVANALIKEAEK